MYQQHVFETVMDKIDAGLGVALIITFQAPVEGVHPLRTVLKERLNQIVLVNPDWDPEHELACREEEGA